MSYSLAIRVFVGAGVLTCLPIAVIFAGPSYLSTRSPSGPEPHATQHSFAPLRTVPLNANERFEQPAAGNFQAQPLPRALPTYHPGFTTSFDVPAFVQPSAWHLTYSGVPLKQVSLREMSIDPTLRAPSTITEGEARAPARTSIPHATHLSPGLDAAPRPRTDHGPQWLTVEVELTPAVPRKAFNAALPK